MLSLKKLSERSRTTKIELPDGLGDIEVTYRIPTGTMQKEWRRLQRAVERGEDVGDGADNARLLTDLIVSWNVGNSADGDALPPSRELIEGFAVDVQSALLTGIFNAIIPPKAPSGS